MVRKQDVEHLLTPEDLAERWGMTVSGLAQQRSEGRGPKFIKLGRSYSSPVRYRMADIIDYEDSNGRSRR